MNFTVNKVASTGEKEEEKTAKEQREAGTSRLGRPQESMSARRESSNFGCVFYLRALSRPGNRRDLSFC